jgi:Uma2 family endonuclease
MIREMTSGSSGQRKLAKAARTDFLEWEAAQSDRHELVGNVVRAMAGGTVDHNRIAGNIHAALHGRLPRGQCEVFQQNMQLTPAENEDATYPDVMVVCKTLQGGEPRVAEATVIVEVTSPSTEQDDIVRKWQGYQRIPALRHYLIVSQGGADIQSYSRESENDAWVYRRVTSPDARVDLPAVGVSLALSEVYARTKVMAA